MLNKKLKEISLYKAKIAALEKSILAERQTKLKKLQSDLGYSSTADLIEALRSLNGAAPSASRGKASSSTAAASGAGRKRRKRAKVTDEMRQGMVTALRGGGKAADVAKQFGVSIPTVQNVKRAAGLTRGSNLLVAVLHFPKNGSGHEQARALRRRRRITSLAEAPLESPRRLCYR
jgi:hypothetical protein